MLKNKKTVVIKGIELENQGGEEIASSHWEERILFENDESEEYRYFNNKNNGRVIQRLHPFATNDGSEDITDFYEGSFTEKSKNGNFWNKTSYIDTNENIFYYYKSSDLNDILYEKNSNNSFCILSSLIKNKIYNYNIFLNGIL